ncbi:MAG: heavy-metal-associated domain-containing protein [Gammaproteobacteria bacterium]|nr:heavy-metal-associated domain-containing protein [Gammaproteobacteria bacterium]MDH5728565.1 heavy-metal-associated domain-containing protein [Gammaproteobacteria bacterium]
MQEEFSVQNVKCGGCVANIENGLKTANGVTSVNVTIDGGLVEVEGEDLNRADLSAKLTELGYPEK